jgi:hypothetical protein
MAEYVRPGLVVVLKPWHPGQSLRARLFRVKDWVFPGAAASETGVWPGAVVFGTMVWTAYGQKTHVAFRS